MAGSMIIAAQARQVPDLDQGKLLDSMESETRALEGARRFCKQAAAGGGPRAEWVTSDGHDCRPRAIGETAGRDVIPRCTRSLNNRLQQDHRSIKERYDPLRGLGSIASASFCRAFDGVRQFFLVRFLFLELLVDPPTCVK
jgi:putative transposase